MSFTEPYVFSGLCRFWDAPVPMGAANSRANLHFSVHVSKQKATAGLGRGFAYQLGARPRRYFCAVVGMSSGLSAKVCR
jgi:hypothetical protein